MEPSGLKCALLTTSESLLVALERDVQENLFVYCLQPFSLYKVINLELPFFPTSLKCHGNLIAIAGDERVGVLNFTTYDAFVLIGRPGDVVIDYSWHPLSENCLAVLTASNTLKLFDVSESATYPEVEIPINRASRFKSFTFLPESGRLTMHRFAVLCLTERGDLFSISPVLPRKFYLDSSVWTFTQILRRRDDTFSLKEPKLKEWFKGISAASHKGFKSFVSLSQDFLNRYTPACLGPINDKIDNNPKFLQVICLHSDSPTVLALQDDLGNLHILLSFDDIIPSFGIRKAEVSYLYKETLPVQSVGLGLLRPLSQNVFYYMQGGQLYEIVMGWISQLNEQFRLRRIGHEVLEPTTMHSIRENLSKVDSFEIVESSYNEKKAYISTDNRLKELVIANTAGQSNVEFNFLSIQDASEFPRLSDKIEAKTVTPLKLTDDQNPGLILCSQASEIQGLLSEHIVPLESRCEVVKHHLNSCMQKHAEQLKLLSSIQQHLKTSDSSSRHLKGVLEEHNSIKSRLTSIFEKIKLIRRPLSKTEKELEAILVDLESKTSRYKAKAFSVRREIQGLFCDPSNPQLDGVCPPIDNLQRLMKTLQTYTQKVERLESLGNS